MKAKFEKLISGSTPVLVDFYATWCGPCKAVPPILKQTKDTLGDKVTIIKVDIDKNGPLANQYKVQAVPTLILFKSGRIIWQQAGVVPANQLISKIQAVL
jgi:thioredoxin 1